MIENTVQPDRARLPARITKPSQDLRLPPNLVDHGAVCAGFSWEQARQRLEGLPGGGLNMAHEAVDRHLGGAHAARTAIRWIGKDGTRRAFTYTELAAATNRFANALRRLGVQPGERVFVLMGRLPELYVAVLGALKAGCVVTPLFSAFGPEPIATRCEMGDARVLVTTPELYQRKVAQLRDRLPGLRHVILVGETRAAEGPGVQRWGELVDTASPVLQHRGHPGRHDGAAALHQRHHRAAQGRDARARGGVGARGDRALRARPARRGRVLVHRRSRLGHRHQLRHHRAAGRRA